MRITSWSCLFLSVACTRASNLPPTPASATACSSDVIASFPLPHLDSLRHAWYGKQWRALGEGPLCRAVGDREHVYRFVWVPTFDPTVAVTITIGAQHYRLRAKKLSGAGGYEPGRLVICAFSKR
jgi:hypothetical protein